MGAMDDARTQPEVAVPHVRWIEDAATLKAMADPTRLAILRRMMASATSEGLRHWSAKELAAALGEPQTKLYRHLKQLEETGLIRVAETRLVSGIVEQRYVAAQTSLEIARDFIQASTTRDEKADLFAAGIDAYRRDLITAVRDGRVDLHAEAAPEVGYRKPLLMFGEVRLSPARALEFRDQLAAVIDEFLGPRARPESYTGADAVELSVLLGCYTENQDTKNQDTKNQDRSAAEA